MISAGVFNKGLGLASLWSDLLALGVFFICFIAIAALLLKKQER
jgi:ribosome-dependent ATPase